jgi:hypothetical protein
MGTPQTFPMASPPAYAIGFGVARVNITQACTAVRPASTRLEPVLVLRGFDHWFLQLVHLPILLDGPGPSGSADPFRRCQGCSHPPLRLQERAALSFNEPLRRSTGGVLSSPHGQQRLVAHAQIPADRQQDHIRREPVAREGRSSDFDRVAVATGSHASSLMPPSPTSQCNRALHREGRVHPVM